MKTNLLSKFLFTVGVFALTLISFPAAAHAGPVLPAVGPTPPGQYDKVTCGYLEVYSRTQEKEWGQGSYYYPHTPYWLYNSSGKKIRTVGNNSDGIDESPEKVELPPGIYTVKAWSDNDGLVTVPVVIKLARTTSVHLEDSRGSNEAASNSDKAVKSPSGQFVGWKA
jgi:hypothetical protein